MRRAVDGSSAACFARPMRSLPLRLLPCPVHSCSSAACCPCIPAFLPCQARLCAPPSFPCPATRPLRLQLRRCAALHAVPAQPAKRWPASGSALSLLLDAAKAADHRRQGHRQSTQQEARCPLPRVVTFLLLKGVSRNALCQPRARPPDVARFLCTVLLGSEPGRPMDAMLTKQACTRGPPEPSLAFTACKRALILCCLPSTPGITWARYAGLCTA